MKKIILLFGFSLFTVSCFAQDLTIGYIYKADEIEKLLKGEYAIFKDPSCLKNYLVSTDYRSRHRQGSKIRSVSVCPRDKILRFNIRFDQMGGTIGSIGSINTIVNCDLVKPMAYQPCYEE